MGSLFGTTCLCLYCCQQNIRELALELLGRENNKVPFPPPPTKNELRAFQEDSSCGPTKAKFRLDLRGPKCSPWNIALSKVFANAYLNCQRYPAAEKGAISEAFITHIRVLQTQYDQLLADGSYASICSLSSSGSLPGLGAKLIKRR